MTLQQLQNVCVCVSVSLGFIIIVGSMYVIMFKIFVFFFGKKVTQCIRGVSFLIITPEQEEEDIRLILMCSFLFLFLGRISDFPYHNHHQLNMSINN